MNLLLDTHLILWAAGQPDKLPTEARALLLEPVNQVFFSPVNLWEISIKNGLGHHDFSVDPRRLWRMLLANGYREVPISSEHAIAVNDLPRLHKDPFDRILLAQARVEGLELLTVDKALADYGDPVRRV